MLTRFPSVHIHRATPRLHISTRLYVETLLQLEKKTWDSQLDICYVTEAEMTDINTMHRQKHACTDVLTFTERGREGALVDDLLFGSGPHTTEWSLERRNEGTDFGSIYVCVDYIYKKSFAESHRNLPFSDYLKLSLIHAFLHSIGYNHETADEMTEMIHREQFLTRRISHLERRFPAHFSGIDGLDYMRNKGSIVY